MQGLILLRLLAFVVGRSESIRRCFEGPLWAWLLPGKVRAGSSSCSWLDFAGRSARATFVPAPHSSLRHIPMRNLHAVPRFVQALPDFFANHHPPPLPPPPPTTV